MFSQFLEVFRRAELGPTWLDLLLRSADSLVDNLQRCSKQIVVVTELPRVLYLFASPPLPPPPPNPPRLPLVSTVVLPSRFDPSVSAALES